MRIGICGAQSVGKTTLLNALRSEKVFDQFKICNEVTRRVREYGLLINENGNDVTQSLIMQEHIVNIFMNRDMITDRTALDGLVYSKYLNEQGKVSDKALERVKKIFNKCIPHYDLLFYIQPEFEIEDDGIRSVDVDFRNRIVELFEQEIENNNLNVIRLSGSVRERTEQLINAYKNKEQEYTAEMESACDY